MTARPAIHVTRHAIERYCERIGAESEAEARIALCGRSVQAAVAFGARIVRLTHGRIVLDLYPDGSANVITVVPLETLPVQLVPAAWGGVPLIAQAMRNGDAA